MDDTRSTAELFDLAKREVQSSNPDDDTWEPIYTLRLRSGDEVFQTARRWCASAEASEREVAARILAQIGQPDDTYHAESVRLLIGLLSDPVDSVIGGAAQGLGHRGDPAAIPHLLPLVGHPDADVRFGVMAGLSSQDDPRAIAALIKFSSDEDRAVRDWATFGLGSLTEVDTLELREALVARTTDEDDATRGEALIGLAERKDERVIAPLIRELTGSYHGTGAIEAAEITGWPIFHESLVSLRTLVEKHQPWFLRGYEEALAACRPHEDTPNRADEA